jgi:hypothetical protein
MIGDSALLKHHRPEIVQNKLLWCFDEAQCDLYELARDLNLEVSML